VRERESSPPPPGVERRSWDAVAIAGELGVHAEPRLDPLHGKGVRLRLGESPILDLELFPTAQMVRLSAPDISLSFVQETAPRLAPEGVIFEAPERTLSIAPTGETRLRIGPPKPAEWSAAPVERAEGAMAQETPVEGLLDDPAAREDGCRPVIAMPKETEKREARVRLAGQLGADVRYRTTRDGKLIASFPLAVTQDDGTVRWQDVLLFGDRAAKLRAGDAPKRGQCTEVVGYLHQKEVTSKDGATRLVEEIYGVVVKPR